MEADDLLCSRNARPFRRLRLRLRLSSDQSCLGVSPPLNLDLSFGHFLKERYREKVNM